MGRSRRERAEGRLDMTQVVGHRMSAARASQGRSQEWVAERMARFTGANWTASTVSLAENSATSSRPRSFTANDIVALARTFALPIPYFFIPPDEPTPPPDFPDAPQAGWDYLLALLVGDDGQRKQLAPLLADESLIREIPIPPGDRIEDSPDRVAGNDKREISGTSLLAAAFYGIMTSNIRGVDAMSKSVGSTAEVLESMAWAVRAIEGYALERFVDPQLAADIEEVTADGVEADS
jgi:transcriptional regulator with XRE-family HTH domain